MIELEYTEINGLLYPNLAVDNELLFDDLDKYENLRLNYLHEHQPQMYRELLFSGKLPQHCADMEEVSFELAERIRGQCLGMHPAPAEEVERIHAFEQSQMIADEIVLCDFIYS